MNVLYLVKRGCDFSNREKKLLSISDVGNHRVSTIDYDIKAKNGKEYYIEFTLWRDRGHVRYNSKRGNNLLKHPIFEIDEPYAMGFDTQVETENGTCYRDLTLEKSINKYLYTYTRENILKTVNEISIKQYDKIMLLGCEKSIDVIPDILKQSGNREKYVIDNLYETDHVEYSKDHYIIRYRTLDGHGFLYDLKQKKIVG